MMCKYYKLPLTLEVYTPKLNWSFAEGKIIYIHYRLVDGR